MSCFNRLSPLTATAFGGAAVLSVCLLLGAAATAAEPTPNVYVSTQGNDAWSGRTAEPNAAKTDGPVATVGRAEQLVRQIKKDAGRAGPIVVAIRGGTYFLDKPIEFGPDDSGTEQTPIVYAAYGQERPVLSGGVKLDGWRVGPDGRWRLTLDEVKAGKWSFAQLFVNDQRRYRPRLPRHGYYQIARTIPCDRQVHPKGQDRFGYAGDDFRADWANLHDVEVLAFHECGSSRKRT